MAGSIGSTMPATASATLRLPPEINRIRTSPCMACCNALAGALLPERSRMRALALLLALALPLQAADRRKIAVLNVGATALFTYLSCAIPETDDPDVDEEGRVVHGFTWGLFPGVWSGAQRHVWNHEAVHALQSLQLDSVEPPALTLDRERRLVRVRTLRAGALNFADNVSAQLIPYEERWVEIEAYRFAEDAQPPP